MPLRCPFSLPLLIAALAAGLLAAGLVAAAPAAAQGTGTGTGGGQVAFLPLFRPLNPPAAEGAARPAPPASFAEHARNFRPFPVQPPQDAAGLGTAGGGVEQGMLCRAAIRQAEREAGIPAHLLMAIARVESGRRDPETGAFHPWPWTINAEGRGSFYPAKSAAIAAVRAQQAQGVRSIDVGCMQVNLRHHPDAFPSLEAAFDPLTNARYAARFLTELQQARGGDWRSAAAAYHSNTPEFAGPYQARVMAALQEETRSPITVPAGALAGLGGVRPVPPLPTGGGGFMLSNGAERAQVLAAAPGTNGRGLDAYRGAPIPITGRGPALVPARARARRL
jgi:soluble lytic murein transglycosylase-like protein